MKIEFKNQLITALLSSPIVYIPHSHFAFVDEVLHEIIHPLNGHRSILDIDDNSVGSLRLEAVQKLKLVRPRSIGQASRISGVSPADISVLLIYLKMKTSVRKV